MRAEDFLSAYGTIEKALKDLIGRDKRETFSRMVDIASKKSRAVQRYATDLKEFGDLRNAIVHERTDAHVIADPRQDVVDKIERIATNLANPPSISRYFMCDVFVSDIDDNLSALIKKMVENDFSQVPLQRDGMILDVVTAETVAAWMFHNIEQDVISISETTINEVLQYKDSNETFLIKKKSDSLFDVLSIYQDAPSSNSRISAVLFSENGRNNETILGIITPYDIPKIVQEISLPQG